MTNPIVCDHMNEASRCLTKINEQLSHYLDEHYMEKLLHEEGSKNRAYYKEVLKALRRLEVISDEALDAVKKNLRSNCEQEQMAKKTLYGIYHKCILEFYAPKNDSWYEDSRASYTRSESIRFRNMPPRSVAQLVYTLDRSFQIMRDQFSDYESIETGTSPIRKHNSASIKQNS
ncbi:YpuI family protein [Aquibacillus sp. 3ASR75-11]|uniref:YpuI family protein n=1 Tax=Terrihalobacillus insolitus TaxID=2950438 RepID=A0A9X3WV79_9BACI|nr:DUF3907 family protein [Terrihalobacillus insolitus]MDC3413094.1 YpuI family protein [Terrihalobacillus insolitus]MDC3424836.1 YpuI family protein [Terrihalobacillus insolitus]